METSTLTLWSVLCLLPSHRRTTHFKHSTSMIWVLQALWPIISCNFTCGVVETGVSNRHNKRPGLFGRSLSVASRCVAQRTVGRLPQGCLNGMSLVPRNDCSNYPVSRKVYALIEHDLIKEIFSFTNKIKIQRTTKPCPNSNLLPINQIRRKKVQHIFRNLEYINEHQFLVAF